MPSYPPEHMQLTFASETVAKVAYANDTFRYIIHGPLRDWVELFAQRSLDYGDSASDLGAAGQYSDLHRKMRKLKRALWDGETLTGEQPREILLDLVGHCFLAIRYLDETGGTK